MTSELNLIQHFQEITNTLVNLEKAVNVFDFAFEKGISTEQAQFILNSFILQSKEVSRYVVIFRAEILEFDETNKSEKTTIKFFPSHSEHLGILLAQAGNDKILDLGIFCIFKKIEDFELKDYGVFAHEMRKCEILNLSDFEIISSNPQIKGNLSGVDSKKASKNIALGKASAASSELEKNFHNKVSISKAAAASNSQKPLNSSNAPSTNKTSVAKDPIKSKDKSHSNIASGNIRDIFANKSATAQTTFAEISLSNNDLYDIDEGDEAEIHKKTDDQMDIEKEIPIPSIAKNNLQSKKPAKTEILKIDAKAQKRKNNFAAEEDEDKIGKKNLAAAKHSKIKPENKQGNVSSDSEERTMEPIATKERLQEPKKKVRKTRKVKKTSTYKDEDGFDVTSEIFEDEEYWTDEKSEASAGKANFRNNLHASKPGTGAAAKKPAAAAAGKKGAANQTSLNLFFKK